MLANYFTIHAVNKTGQLLDNSEGGEISLRLSLIKFTSGVREAVTTITDTFSNADIADGSSQAMSSEVDNVTSRKCIVAKGFVSVTCDNASADGTFAFYLEESDDNSNWPSDAAYFDPETDLGAPIAILTFDGADTHATNFSF